MANFTYEVGGKVNISQEYINERRNDFVFQSSNGIVIQVDENDPVLPYYVETIVKSLGDLGRGWHKERFWMSSDCLTKINSIGTSVSPTSGNGLCLNELELLL